MQCTQFWKLHKNVKCGEKGRRETRSREKERVEGGEKKMHEQGVPISLYKRFRFEAKLNKTERVLLQFRETTKKVSFRFVSLKKCFVTEVLLLKKFCFGNLAIKVLFRKFPFRNSFTSKVSLQKQICFVFLFTDSKNRAALIDNCTASNQKRSALSEGQLRNSNEC